MGIVHMMMRDDEYDLQLLLHQHLNIYMKHHHTTTPGVSGGSGVDENSNLTWAWGLFFIYIYISTLAIAVLWTADGKGPSCDHALPLDLKKAECWLKNQASFLGAGSVEAMTQPISVSKQVKRGERIWLHKGKHMERFFFCQKKSCLLTLHSGSIARIWSLTSCWSGLPTSNRRRFSIDFKISVDSIEITFLYR